MLFTVSSISGESVQLQTEARRAEEVRSICLLGMLLEGHTPRFHETAVFRFLTSLA